MKEQFVTYEISSKLKELGFDKDCFASICTSHPNELIPYRGYPIEGNEDTHFSTINNLTVSNMWIAVPLWQQVIDWFREEHNLYINIEPRFYNDWEFSIFNINNHLLFGAKSLYMKRGLNYHKAREQSILKAIEICQNKK